VIYLISVREIESFKRLCMLLSDFAFGAAGSRFAVSHRFESASLTFAEAARKVTLLLPRSVLMC
jgi:hypothetical protein